MSSSPSDSPRDSALTSSTQTPGADAAPDAASPAPTELTRATLGASRLRPFLCCAGALGVGLSLAPLLLQPGSTRPGGTGISSPEIALAMEDTLVIAPAMPPGALLRGRIRLVAGETDALGRAPAGGQVARHLVENGARVQRGDAIIEISSGAARRGAPLAEGRQNRAEQSQVAASDAQNALAQKISLAQTRLLAAQQRVERAQAQTAVARDVVRRLQNGQRVASSEIPAPFRGASSGPDQRKPARARSSQRAASRLSGAAQIASRQAEAAREAAQESARALQTARDTLADAQSGARIADDKRQNAAKVVANVEARFDAEKATGAEVEAARAAQKDAQSAVDAADQALIFAKAEVGKREKNASAAQSYARSSAEQAAKALASASLEASPDDSDLAPAGSPEAQQEAPAGTAQVTLEKAIRFASAALDESQRASRDAERIHAEIESYQGQVTRSRSRVEAATEDLAQAQQGVMDSVPRPRFTSCYAPSSGIVTWISRLAREVSQGDAVFGIARRQRVAARFEDKSGLWRAIRPGAILSAFVVDAPAPPSVNAPNNGISTGENAEAMITPDSVAKLGASRAIELKMIEVQSPASEGQAAKLTGAPVSSSGSAGELVEGAQILVSMPRPGQTAALSLPVSALVQRGDATFVALLAPLSSGEIQALSAAESKAKRPALESPESSAIPAAGAGEAFRLRWTRVETGRSDGLRLEITTGLQAGARVVSRPEDLEAMGFTPTVDGPSTVFDKKNATPESNAASNPAPDAGVLVRLTPASA